MASYQGIFFQHKYVRLEQYKSVFLPMNKPYLNVQFCPYFQLQSFQGQLLFDLDCAYAGLQLAAL
ncbi:MAG: hypothetical protein BRC40_13985 [Cyanobacteria bacterium QH_8_48_120]|nr:MAG: hypothetical protein BRC40_13985 [Cyanobacteria bacterium QH_8_48_120]